MGALRAAQPIRGGILVAEEQWVRLASDRKVDVALDAVEWALPGQLVLCSLRVPDRARSDVSVLARISGVPVTAEMKRRRQAMLEQFRAQLPVVAWAPAC